MWCDWFLWSAVGGGRANETANNGQVLSFASPSKQASSKVRLSFLSFLFLFPFFFFFFLSFFFLVERKAHDQILSAAPHIPSSFLLAAFLLFVFVFVFVFCLARTQPTRANSN